MDEKLIEEVHQLNPWLRAKNTQTIDNKAFISRIQVDELLDPEWDSLWTILVGPRRAGKTTMGRYLAGRLLEMGRFKELFYLNCDYLSIREWLSSPLFISQAMEHFSLTAPILFIDEVQRLPNPGLLLKAVIDLGLPVKHIATGSSQLEMRSKVQEFLTGRQHSTLVLPLSHEEWEKDSRLVHGSYPQVVQATKKREQLREIYERYIQKDIIEILKIGQPDVLSKLMTLVAHSSGQLVNHSQLANDCKVGTTMIRNYIDILEQTFVLAKVTPFVGNKRKEVTSNPIYYYIDNGFRNMALQNFTPLDNRIDTGLLVESYVFQELLKYRVQHYLDYSIHYWRTRSGAEVDFVLKYGEKLLPIEVKYQRFSQPTVTRGFRSFIEAYQPPVGVVVTKEAFHKVQIDHCTVHFMPLSYLERLFEFVAQL